jgi:zinc transport system ATP-binding protein
MLGLLEPSNGEVKLFGVPVKKFRDWPRLGYVPQKAINFESRLPISALEVVLLGRIGRAGLGRRLTKHDREIALQSLETVGLAGFGGRKITELSGGQQQRVLLAKALAGEPELLILDEPTVGIDMQSQEEFYQLLASLNKQRGLTLVLVSHDIDVVVNEVTKLACINQGLVYHGEPKEFMKEDYLTQLYGHNRHMILHGHV